jgi:hypothetical protein
MRCNTYRVFSDGEFLFTINIDGNPMEEINTIMHELTGETDWHAVSLYGLFLRIERK